jgi:glycosyltransferase involved in cell wall biosynthesis
MPELPPRSPIATAPLSVVLPVRNGAPILREVAVAWDRVLEGLKRDYEIIVVDDGSSDDTPARAESLTAELPRLRTLRLPEERGVGAAFRAGLKMVQQPLVLLVPCDPRYAAKDLRKLLESIDKVDCVSGCRVTTPVPGWLRWMGRVYRLMVRVLFGVPLDPLPGWLGWKQCLFRHAMRLWTGVRIYDLNSPLQLFRRELFDRIPIQSDGPFVHAEVLAKANFLECPLGEVEVRGPPDDPAQELRSLLREARRVLGHPEFGPPLEASRPKEESKSDGG